MQPGDWIVLGAIVAGAWFAFDAPTSTMAIGTARADIVEGDTIRVHGRALRIEASLR